MREQSNHRVHAYRAPLITVGVIIVIWGVITETGLVNPLFLPKLILLARALAEVLGDYETFWNVLFTSYRAFAGLVLSMVVAIPLGLIFGRNDRLYRFFELPVDFIRSIPSSALFPLFILFFGIGDLSKAFVVFYGCSLILLVNTIYGARPNREKQDRINMLRSFKASPYQIFSLAVARDALPSILAGLRISVSMAFVLVIVTEMFLGATSGLGRQIYDAYLQYDIPKMYAAIVILGAIGFSANQLFLYLEHKLAFWLAS